jgi:dipeptidyl aminopeptidase/acylaminoacyl peptidase
MADQGRADRNRLAIQGSSAGGYTTLRALTTSTVFTAGISKYGIGDLTALVADTHKFESRYPESLIGAYPDEAALYADRSPINHVDRLQAPILLLQGSEDRVVPPNQAMTFADAARSKGLPVAMIMYDGEGHGFRRAENIVAAQQAALAFLGRVFGFTPADDLPELAIENLGRSGS